MNQNHTGKRDEKIFTRVNAMPPEQITRSSIVRLLTAGFALVLILLITAGTIGIRSIQAVKKNADNLVREQQVANRLIDEVQHQQVSLSEIFSLLARDPDSIDASRIVAQLDETDQNIHHIVTEGMNTSERTLWSQLEGASTAFSTEARRLVTAKDPETFASRDLFRRHEEVIAVIAKLIASGYRRVLAVQKQIEAQTAGVLRDSFVLLGACLLLAVISTVLTVRMSNQLVHRMEWQANELSRVSWHMLENQETTARRFSHELHDELGQSLTAVKSNLLALGSQPGARPQRLEDCMRLVDEAIGNVRQLSQLLRPTILDDFGLEAGLRWLCEGFTSRTGIDVEFRSRLTGRLPDENETHLFRIAQEALTNVARHAGATNVLMELQRTGDEVSLRIQDNGRGLQTGAVNRRGGLGMIGMRARAQSLGGSATVRSDKGTGVLIEVKVPAEGGKVARQDPHLVGG